MIKSLLTSTTAIAIATCLALPLAAKESKHQQHVLTIDCDHKEMSNEGTNNTVTVEYWKDDVKLYSTEKSKALKKSAEFDWNGTPVIGLIYSGLKLGAEKLYEEIKASEKDASQLFDEDQPNCNKDWYAVYISDSDEFPNGKEVNPTHVVLRATGNDALFIDWMVYEDEENSDNRKQFGNNNNKGYCLSKEYSDGKGSWDDYVSGCYHKLKFDLKTGKARGWYKK